MATFPNWKPADLSSTVDAWDIMLKFYTYKDISIALKTYTLASRNGFAPSVGELAGIVYDFKNSKLNDSEAWGLVLKAMKNSSYGYAEEFQKLPEAVQRAVGTAENLKELALTENINLQVESSNFKKTYRAEQSQLCLPQKIKDEIKMIGG